ncbi:MAG: putative polymerase subfamily sigma factor [Ilumatobacteraceae bacterium]|nr:putative polymerase subfamily sigma factor [Ilumatobacteraceae bacterium]
MNAHRTSTAITEPPQTFEQFFAEVWPWAFRLASFLTHDTAAGEDIAQEALTTMSQRWGTTDRPAAYLRTALVNASSNWNRRGRTIRDKLPLLAGAGPVDLDVDELADAIARLPFRQRSVIVLRYYAAMSEAEIAEALDCRPGTVKSLASRALANLSKEIEQ